MSYLLEDMEKWAGDVVDFAAYAKKKAIKTEFANPADPVRDAQEAIKAWQIEQQARKSYIADLEMGIKNDMEQLRQIEAREAKIGLRNKKLAVGAGIGTAATIGGLYAYNRYKKKKRAEAEQEKIAAPKVGLDGFYDIEDTEFKKKYNSHSEAPVGRIYHNPNLPKIQMRHKKDDPSRFEIFLKDQEKTAAREDFVPTKNYGWTQKMPRSYSQWEKFRPKTTEEWDAWEDWQNSADHGDGDDWDKERWKEQKHFAETGETASAWIARSAQERQAEAEQWTMKQQQRAATRKKWMKPIAGAALGAAAAGLGGLTNSRKRY